MEAPFSVIDAVSANENERILKLVGPLTLTTMFDFRDTVRAETTAMLLILDFSEVPYVDSAGMGAIVNAHVSCSNTGRKLALVGMVERVRTMLKMSRVETILALYPTLQEARQALGNR
jgi:anti-sigma B factor antagonist